MEMALVVSNCALVMVTLILAGVDWHKDNMLVQVVQMLRPRGKAWKVAKCYKCHGAHPKHEHHREE
jgi:hypothetical protein